MLLGAVNSNTICARNSSAIQCGSMSAKRKMSVEQMEDALRLKRLWHEEFAGQITQEEVAHRCGWKTQGAFSQYLHGKIPLNLSALLKISKALGVSPTRISPRLSTELETSGVNVNLEMTEGPYIPGQPSKPGDAVTTEFSALAARATPKSRQQLLLIARAAAEHRLTDADIKLLSDIAKRFEQGKPDYRDDYPTIQPDQPSDTDS